MNESKLIQINFISLDGHIHSIGGAGDDFNLSGCLYRVIDLEEADKETIHLLIFLLMQFMSRADLVCDYRMSLQCISYEKWFCYRLTQRMKNRW